MGWMLPVGLWLTARVPQVSALWPDISAHLPPHTRMQGYLLCDLLAFLFQDLLLLVCMIYYIFSSNKQLALHGLGEEQSKIHAVASSRT